MLKSEAVVVVAGGWLKEGMDTTDGGAGAVVAVDPPKTGTAAAAPSTAETAPADLTKES